MTIDDYILSIMTWWKGYAVLTPEEVEEQRRVEQPKIRRVYEQQNLVNIEVDIRFS